MYGPRFQRDQQYWNANFCVDVSTVSDYKGISLWIANMDVFAQCLIVQVCLAFGMTGLFWPEKLLPLFEVLMFPWAASYRMVRVHSLATIALSLILVLQLFGPA